MLTSVKRIPLSVPTTATTHSALTTVPVAMDTTWKGKEEALALVSQSQWASQWAVAGLLGCSWVAIGSLMYVCPLNRRQPF